MEDLRPWTFGHPDGPRKDVHGTEWYACDPYPTWYRRDENGRLITHESPTWR